MSAPAPAPASDLRETSGVSTRLILAYVRERHGDDGVEDVLARANVSELRWRLEDEHQWLPFATKVALLEATVAVTGDAHAASKVGALVMTTRTATPVKVALSMLGSPVQVLRRIDRAAGKFTTIGRFRPVAVSDGAATVGYRLPDGYAPHHLNCDFTSGLLAQIPALFGLPPASVAHSACQTRGAEECVFELRWQRARRWRRRRRRPAIDAMTVNDRFLALQDTVADLVSSDDLDEVLARVATRASTSVRASRYLLAVRLEASGAVHVHGDGIEPGELHSLGRQLLATGDLHLDDVDVVSAEVVSSRRSYGHLAALFPARTGAFEHEQGLLAAYARLAAVALDSATALAAARTQGRTAQQLLDLANDLAEAVTVEEVSRIATRAVPAVVAAPRASLFLFDAGRDQATLASQHGWEPHLLAELAAFAIGVADTAEVDRLAVTGRPAVYTPQHPDPFVARSCERLSVGQVVAVPVVAAGELHGLLFASWLQHEPVPGFDDDLFARIQGLAHHVGTALGRARLLETARHQALHDSLTGLANRALLEDRVDRSLAVRRRTGRLFALLFVDLDRFKSVNDSLGHAAGDQLLRQAAARLRAVVRDSDTVARLGGDEFAVLLGDVAEPRDAEIVAGKIVEVFAEDFDVDGHAVYVTASVGMSLPEPDDDTEAVLRGADAAMYLAKVAGRNAWCWRGGDSDDAAEQQSLMAALRHAISHGRLVLHYQPQMSRTGQLAGVEALVRWNDPERGLLPPSVFLPVAEGSSLIVPLDLAVVRLAVDEAARWQRAGRPPVRLAINVSARTFCATAFLSTVRSSLRATGFPPHLLEFELTERERLPSFFRAQVMAQSLTEMGVGIAVDDVGRGYSSLSWLRELPIRRMKLDRSFVADLTTSRAADDMTTGLITLGRQLGCAVLAEGVETAEQLAFLAEHGCDEMQGYYLGRPMAAADLWSWIDDQALARR